MHGGGHSCNLPHQRHSRLGKVIIFREKYNRNEKGKKEFSDIFSEVSPGKMLSKYLLLAKNRKNSHLTLFVIEGLPIKIFRFPINFKSEVEETSLLSGRKFFYHVVLGIAYKGAFKTDIYFSVKCFPKTEQFLQILL